jgi:hypothetical protein
MVKLNKTKILTTLKIATLLQQKEILKFFLSLLNNQRNLHLHAKISQN